MNAQTVSISLKNIHAAIDCAIAVGRYDLARRISREVLVKLPDNAELKLLFRKACWECDDNASAGITRRLGELRSMSRSKLWKEVEAHSIALVRENPKVSEAAYHLLFALFNLGQVEEAQRQASDLDIDLLVDVNQLSQVGEVLHHLGHHAKATAAFENACAIAPGAATYANLGAALLASGQKQAAVTKLEIATSFDPDNSQALTNLAAAFLETGRLDECERAARKVLQLDSSSKAGMSNLGNALLLRKNWSEAAEVFENFLCSHPMHWDTRTKLMYCLAQNAEWTRLEVQKEILRTNVDHIASALSAPNPWVLLSIFDDPELHKLAAHRYARRLNNIHVDRPPRNYGSAEKFHIGYFSADFYNHPTTQLILGVLSSHDRGKFVVHAFSFSPNVSDIYRERVRSSVDYFHDVSTLSNEEIAQKSQELGIDIAVDLNGYTKNHRAAIFSYRAAPIQVGYLGYPGTLMLDTLDYVLADGVTVPDTDDTFFSEEVLRLPRCYQVNDDQFDVPDKCPSKKQCGLPQKGLILACFNSIHKVQQETFFLWLGVMKRTENSILWLFCDSFVARKNIEGLAGEAGVDPARIVWAERLERPQHLARHKHIDVYLDTWPYNAHTTASDALRMGVPIVTLLGRSFASRVCASLLLYSGLAELVARDKEEYLEKVMRLCRDQAYRKKVANTVCEQTRATGLFSPEAFTKDLETCFLGVLQE